MNISICDGDICYFCSTLLSCCSCEFSESPWSESTSEGSFGTSDGREEPAKFDADEPAFCTGCFLADPLENADFGVDAMIQCLGRGSQHPYAVSTPKHNDHAEKWESPGTMPPPESSSPVIHDADSSPFSMDPALLMSLREDHQSVDLCQFGRPLDNGQWRVKEPLVNDLVDSNASIFPNTTSMRLSLPLSADPSESIPSMLVGSAAQEPLDERQSIVIKRPVVADMHDTCAVETRTAIERTSGLQKFDESDRVSVPWGLMPASRKRSIGFGPTILDLTISTELEPSSSYGSENDEPHDATTISSHDSHSSKMPSRGVSFISIPSPAEATMDNRLKRRRSSVGSPPESKKAKLDRPVSQVNCPSNLSVQCKYKATRVASLRRAESLTSEASEISEISACSENSRVRPLVAMNSRGHC